MGTSKSNEHRRCWGEALVFSGRPDPTWPVDAATGEGLMQLWDSLEPSTQTALPPPGLGYRGSILRCQDGREWRAYGGSVSASGPGGAETRRDATREFERAVLASAPTGLLPPLDV